MQAFISKALESGKGFDPVCSSAADTFFKSYKSGDQELESIFAAAKYFLTGYKSNPAPASQSQCAAAAARAYASAVKNSQSDKMPQALLAFIDAAVSSNDDGLSPVCGASAEALTLT